MKSLCEAKWRRRDYVRCMGAADENRFQPLSQQRDLSRHSPQFGPPDGDAALAIAAAPPFELLVRTNYSTLMHNCSNEIDDGDERCARLDVDGQQKPSDPRVHFHRERESEKNGPRRHKNAIFTRLTSTHRVLSAPKIDTIAPTRLCIRASIWRQ